jgi:hypothetical protein
MNIENILSQINGGETLTEDSKKVIAEAFEEAVKVKAQETVKLEVENAERRLDEQHSEKLDQLLEDIDQKHTEKFAHAMKVMDDDHCKKLMMLKEKYEKIIEKDAKEFHDFMAQQVDAYLDQFLEEAVPAKQLQEAVENIKARRLIEKIKEVVSLDDEFINETIANGIKESKQSINGLKSELNEAMKSNIKLNQELNRTKAELVLEQKTIGFPKNKKAYVMRALKDKDPEYIVEQIDKVVEMFDRDEDGKVQLLKEEAGNQTVTHDVGHPARQKQSLNESSEQNSHVNVYLEQLKQMDPASRFEQQRKKQ